VNIRKFVVRAARLSDLVELGTLTDHAARWLERRPSPRGEADRRTAVRHRQAGRSRAVGRI
jgi:hypothetical protein